MYHPTTRVLAVFALLQTHGRMTGAELAERLEVNIRTVRDYITMLQDLGAPITAERGRYGAYELDAGFKLPPMLFTNDEALALTLGLLAARQLALGEIIEAVESARAKLEHAMPPALKSRMQALTTTSTLDLNIPPVEAPSEVLLLLSQAAQGQQQVQLRYQSRENQHTERNFDPYGLVCHQGKWYTVGRCHLRQDLRSFRLDRVLEVALTPARFERPANFDALLYIIQTIATLPRQFTFEVLLQTDLVTAQKEIFDMLGVLEWHEEGVLLRGTADDLQWVARQLAKLPFDFVVHQPPALQEALLQRAAELVRLAQR